jgi:hypothetical protein
MNSTTDIKPSEEIKVELEDNVPIPPHEVTSGPSGKWLAILADMKVGQSFPLDSRNSNALDRENVKRAVYYYNHKTKIRHPGGPEYAWRKFGKDQIRVWRIR